MTVLAENEITELLLRLGISNKCNLIYTNTISNLPVFLENRGKRVGIIVPKEILSLIRQYKIPAYIFISEKLPENAILICG